VENGYGPDADGVREFEDATIVIGAAVGGGAIEIAFGVGDEWSGGVGSVGDALEGVEDALASGG
jgi:hypothetical protein